MGTSGARTRASEVRRRRRQELFDAVLDLPPEARADFLARECGDDEALKSDLEGLLSRDAGASFLDRPLYRPATGLTGQDDDVPDPAPVRIGDYEIVRVVGEGGMGVVFEARQLHPPRTVALKVVRPALASPSFVKRLEKEASILGQLEHPGIARLYEVGQAPTEGAAHLGPQPYLAMQFVRGEPLDVHVRRRRLEPRQILALVAEVCDAVQHAHEHGVVHRDLKPANVLVSEQGRVTVVDFGVAHILGEDERARTLLTRTGQLVGTFAYMSPEQVVGDRARIDARSDVYSLGVILYELLAGRPPHDLDGRPVPEAARTICEEEAPHLGLFGAGFRGDVETIVAKALEKQPARRYASAGELAADLRRHLGDEVIVARPTSRLYQLQKFARRHRAVVGGAAATLASLLLGLVGTIGFALREAEQHGLAHESEQAAQRNLELALRRSYQQSIQAAEAALERHDASAARFELDSAIPELRGWEWRHFASRLDESLVAFPTGLGGADATPASFHLGVSADGERLIGWSRPGAGTAGRVLGSYDLRPSPPAPTLLLPLPRSAACGLSADGQRFLYSGRDGRARILDTASGAERPAEGAGRDLRIGWPFLVHADTGRLFGMSGGALVARDPVVGTSVTLLSTRPPKDGRVHCAVFSRDGRLLALPAGHGPSTVVVWDLVESRRLLTLPVGRSDVQQLAFSPDGRRLAAVSQDRLLRQWELPGGEPSGWTGSAHHDDRAVSVAYSPDGRRIATGGKDRTVRLWDADTGEPLRILVGHENQVLALAFSADGATLASGDLDGVVRLWEVADASDPRILRGHDSFVYGVATSPDGARIYSAAWDRTVRVWDADSGEPAAAIAVAPEGRGVVRALAVHPAGAQLAIVEVDLTSSANDEARVLVLDTSTGVVRVARTVAAPGVRPKLAYHRSGARLYLSDVEDGQVVVLETNEFQELARAAGSGPCALSAGASPLLATMSPENRILLYDADTLALVRTLAGHAQPVRDLAFSPDGRTLASAGEDRSVRLWDCESGEEVAALEGHTDRVFAVCFSPDGRRLASGSDDHSIRLWSTETLTEVCHLHAHDQYVYELAYSPDGRRLYSASGDTTVRIWELEPPRARLAARRERRRLAGELGPLVGRLFAECASADEVVARLRGDAALPAREREVALQLALGEATRRGATD